MNGLQPIDEVLGTEWLGEELAHVCLCKAFAILRPRACCQRDDRDETDRALPDPPNALVAIHHRHMVIHHQCDIELPLLRVRQGHRAIFCDLAMTASPLQNAETVFWFTLLYSALQHSRRIDQPCSPKLYHQPAPTALPLR